MKGGVGAVPFAGGMLAEIVGQLIPEQRIERLEDYVRKLNERLDAAGSNDKERLTQPEAIELFEEGAVQSSRALSESRRKHIAAVVANGMAGDEKDRIEAKRILGLLSGVDDDQIVILSSHLNRNARDESFLEKHANILRPIGAHLNSSREEFDKETIYELARSHLVTLGLLSYRFKTHKKGELPDFDPRTGTLKPLGREITPLGRLFLSRLGLSDPGEF
ncbi:hypothetical protein EN866_24110 [Mesorhizobium sp. M2D.F.Ca.ET.223.01.1.1]|uniref:hypothetical protein n=1 Tax=Mesorhizobium sp. M2D.F.Ca.ET.223.01.1.1 TaxID=2563940 RepID=UPI001092CD1C|nr:hypothetical protein [Mesorhizobium sp. M2D.F.Ca.ET.223.01.1.1]TGP86386.1 hypothetical protein EN864_24120 [bacterium M00.F.Ca.ET.221.01.1.1]TGR88728.1 hypothetical protein EN866_24110 [Mesorhizobium sp. M2D.F.Ca.ET.223.01.1.1]TGT72977.1 hypothetical protein EN802_13985 [bacterium M00.F.Ca.ET.159.01.1.1]